MSVEDIFTSQVESIGLILSNQVYRNVYGFLSLLGKKWLSWDDNITDTLKSLPNDLSDIAVSFTCKNIVLQIYLIQLLESIQLIIEQYSSEFEYTSKFIILISKLTCLNLPGVSLIPLQNEKDEEIEIPELNNLKTIDSFLYKQEIFINRSFTENTLNKTKQLIFPIWDQKLFIRSSSVYEFWNSSISSYILQELIRIDEETQLIHSILQNFRSVINNCLLFDEDFREIIFSLKEVSDFISTASPVVPLEDSKRVRARRSSTTEAPGRRVRSKSKSFLRVNSIAH